MDEAGRSDCTAFLREKIDLHLSDQHAKRNLNRATTVAIRGALIVTGALTTVVLGLEKFFPSHLTDAFLSTALVLSAVSSALAAWESFSEYARRWIRARVALGTFRDLKDDFDFAIQANGKLNDRQIKEFYSRLKAAVRVENEEWATSRAKAIAQSFREH